MKQTIALITLAVDDLPRALAFYRDGLGWTPKAEMDEIAFFQMNGFAFSLYKKEAMAEEAGGPVALGSRAVALAHNVAGRDEVDAVFAVVAEIDGGRIIAPPTERPWGGYSGYFEDPDGHLWEVAWNPHWTLSPDGTTTI
jgi:catechol 2,3-dioxygenase-like lactoylglutathione lyase family enzyme